MIMSSIEYSELEFIEDLVQLNRFRFIINWFFVSNVASI